MQKVHKKSTNFSRLKSIVCTNETKPPKVEKATGESPVIAKNEAILKSYIMIMKIMTKAPTKGWIHV